ncbi:MAG: ABC transporter substrate-binding protein [Lachnospiraceae bacterium]|nr:ABC transporter substrate-binding protein [Lachnospiraceae bacterium]MBQ9402621.1 ABC transporter substrate-binding protein [Clostridia bacterium]
MKKWIATLTVISLTMAALAGCGGGSTASTTAAPETTAAQTSAEAVTEAATEAAETAAPETEAETQAAEPLFTITDIQGRESAFEKEPETFVVANYIFNFLLVGGKDSIGQIVGMTQDGWEDTRYGEYHALLDAYPEIADIPSIGGYHDNVLDRERILELEPDVLLINRSQYTDNETSIPVWEESGIKVIVLDYHKMLKENDILSTTILGRLLGREDVAKELCEACEKGYEIVAERVAEIPEEEKQVKVYMELGNQGAGTISNSYDGMLWGAIIDNIGAINPAKGKLAEGYGPLDMEYILETDPDIIVIGGSIWSDDNDNDQMRMGLMVDETLARERLQNFVDRDWWQDLKGIKNGRIYAVDHGSLRNALDYTFTEYFAKIVYPDYFEDIDPQAEYDALLKKYLPEMTADGTFMMSWEK